MAEEDVPKTAIITPFGLFELLRMPFGLKNAAQAFQRLMDGMLRDVAFVFVYLDDILVASVDAATHIKHLRELFSLLSLNGININKKCCFGQFEVTYLGHLVNGQVFPPYQRVSKISGPFQPRRPRRGSKDFLGWSIIRSSLTWPPHSRPCTPSHTERSRQLPGPLMPTLPSVPSRMICQMPSSCTIRILSPPPQSPLMLRRTLLALSFPNARRTTPGGHWSFTPIPWPPLNGSIQPLTVNCWPLTLLSVTSGIFSRASHSSFSRITSHSHKPSNLPLITALQDRPAICPL